MKHTYVSSTVFCIKMSQTLPWSGLLKPQSTFWFWFRVDFEKLVSEQFLSLKTALMTSSSWTYWRQGKNSGWVSILSNYSVNRRMGSVFELSQAPVCFMNAHSAQKQIKHMMTVSEIASAVRRLWDTEADPERSMSRIICVFRQYRSCSAPVTSFTSSVSVYKTTSFFLTNEPSSHNRWNQQVGRNTWSFRSDGWL